MPDNTLQKHGILHSLYTNVVYFVTYCFGSVEMCIHVSITILVHKVNSFWYCKSKT